jgi:hypothetical protein
MPPMRQSSWRLPSLLLKKLLSMTTAAAAATVQTIIIRFVASEKHVCYGVYYR